MAINNSTNNGKRKRKAVADTENGSPGPTPNRETDTVLANGHKDNQPRLEIPSVPNPSYTLNRLFSDRELNANLQQTTYEVIQCHTSAASTNNKRRKNNLAVPTDPFLPTATAAATDPMDLEDNLSTTNPDITNIDGPALDTATATSTAMDRTPSQLHHATRSAGRLNPSSSTTAASTNLLTTDPRQTLGELAGRQSAADLIGSYTRANEKPKKADGDDYQRAPPLSEQEVLDDIRLMEAAMRKIDGAIVGTGGRNQGPSGIRAITGSQEDNREAEEDEEEDEESGEAGMNGAGVGAFEAKILGLAVGEEKEDYVGPVGFGKGVP